MPDELNSLLALPLETLAVLVAGYLGYRLAYIGRDESHRAVDVVFLSLAFGLLARAVMAGAGALGAPAWAGIGLGVAAAVAAAAGWRRWGQEGAFRLLRRAKVSMADGHRTALQSVVKRESIIVTQVLVRRKDGLWLMCADTGLFSDTPTGPFWFGEDGSVALYVTHQKEAGGSAWEDISAQALDAEWGDLITVVQADEVSMVEIRAAARRNQPIKQSPTGLYAVQRREVQDLAQAVLRHERELQRSVHQRG